MTVEFKKAQLDNGLTVIAEVNPAAASMAMGFFVRTGSRDETPPVAGVSHFLEHMVFKGTQRRSAFQVNLDFDAMGAQYNAFTTEENTVYYGAVLPEFQEPLADLLSDILRPSLRQGDFDVEKNVILEEIALYEDRPNFRVYDKLMSAHFADHPLGNSVLGSADSIRALKRDDMQAYFDRRYSPGNVTLVAVGKLDFDALLAQARRCCGHWQSYEVTRDLRPAPATGGQTVIPDEKVARQHIGLMSAAPSSQSEGRFAGQLAATVIGDVSGSRLYYALIEPALAEEASMSYDPMDAAGAMITYISCGPEQASAALEITQNELRKFLQDGPTDLELQAAKNKIATTATLGGELPMGRLKAVGMDWVYRRDYIPLAEQIDMLFAVSGEQVLQTARQYKLAETTVLTLGPAKAL